VNFEVVCAAAIAAAVPILWAAIGETFSEKAGVINVELEGMMLVGAFTCVLMTHWTGSAPLGFAGAVLGGVLVALCHGVLTLTIGADQLVSGIALLLLSVGLTSYVLVAVFDSGRLSAGLALGNVAIPGLSDLPVLGPVLFDQSLTTYATYLMVPVAVLVMSRTPWGLRVRACGDNPHAADTAGHSVTLTRYQALIFTGSFAGIAGGVLALTQLGAFVDNMIQGLGFVALAMVLAGNWRLRFVVVFALLFGLVQSMQLSLQASGTDVPPQLMSILPYVFTLVALAGLMGRSRPPLFMGRQYVRGLH
jgi:general nucleoside transport system permease protein